MMKHPLPNFPPNLKERFHELCELCNGEELAALKAEVNEQSRVLRDAPDSFIGPSLEMLDQIVEASEMLLQQYESASDDHRKLIVGALRYFVAKEDAIPDDISTVGLDDDARVLNYVLELLEIEGGGISLETS